jgi:hypothetical protein
MRRDGENRADSTHPLPTVPGEEASSARPFSEDLQTSFFQTVNAAGRLAAVDECVRVRRAEPGRGPAGPKTWAH